MIIEGNGFKKPPAPLYNATKRPANRLFTCCRSLFFTKKHMRAYYIQSFPYICDG